VRIIFDFNTIENTKFTLDENLKYRNTICTSFREHIEARNIQRIQSAFISLMDAECKINKHKIKCLWGGNIIQYNKRIMLL